MTVRRAEQRDIPAILKLLEQVNRIHSSARPDLFSPQSKYGRQEVEELLSNPERPVFVADEGGVLGYLMGQFIDNGKSRNLAPIKTFYIDDLCIDEGARGRGAGTLLYNHALAFAKQNGCYNVTLHVWACNPAAEAFYKKCGMEPQNTTMEKIL